MALILLCIIFIGIASSKDNYFISTYDDITQGSIYLPYANGHCTLTTNHNAPDYFLFECDGQRAFYCDNNGDDTCQQSAPCLFNSSTSSYNTSTASFNTLHYGRCSNDSFATNTNYAQISFYTSSKLQTQCPRNLNSFGAIYIATNICVQQSDASYLMMTCDGSIAQINSYIDDTCTQITTTVIEYSTECSYYSNTGSDVIYSRMEGCYKDNINQTHSTYAPSKEPTMNPTRYRVIPVVTEESMQSTEAEHVKIPHTEHIINSIENVQMLSIVFTVLFVFYLFICLYIWCEERRKRTRLVDTAQQEWNEKFDKYGGNFQGDAQNNIVVLDEEGHREALINEGFLV